MFAADNELKVWRLSEGRLNQLVVVSELGGPWQHFDINITSTEEYQVRHQFVSLFYRPTPSLMSYFAMFFIFNQRTLLRQITTYAF